TAAPPGLRGNETAPGEDSGPPSKRPADRGPDATGATLRGLGEARGRGEGAQGTGGAQASGQETRDAQGQGAPPGARAARETEGESGERSERSGGWGSGRQASPHRPGITRAPGLRARGGVPFSIPQTGAIGRDESCSIHPGFEVGDPVPGVPGSVAM